MKLIQLPTILLTLAMGVSIGYGQESDIGGDKEDFVHVAKMLHGVWAGDADMTAAEIEKMEDSELEEDMIEMMLERVKSVEIEFQDGTFNVLIGDQQMTGAWKVTAAEEKEGTQSLTIQVMPDDSEGVDKRFEIHFMSKKHMKMVDLDEEGPPFVMARKTVRSNDQ